MPSVTVASAENRMDPTLIAGWSEVPQKSDGCALNQSKWSYLICAFLPLHWSISIAGRNPDPCAAYLQSQISSLQMPAKRNLRDCKPANRCISKTYGRSENARRHQVKQFEAGKAAVQVKHSKPKNPGKLNFEECTGKLLCDEEAHRKCNLLLIVLISSSLIYTILKNLYKRRLALSI